MLITGNRIEAVLEPDAAEPAGARRIDAAGRVVAPGFVDVHSHSDVSPLVEPTMDSALRQGVTTLVVGNCGTSAFPAAGIPEVASLAGVATADLGASWTTFGGYLQRVQEARPAVNVAALVGHGALRRQVQAEQRRAPTADELAAMTRLLESGLDEGAFGMSTGLIYAPGQHASTSEIAALAGAMARHGGLYASHVRGEGHAVFEAVAECIEIGRRAGVPSHVSHLKVEGRDLWGRAGELLDLLDDARRRGDDVSADQYPYTAWETSLSAALPPWVEPSELAGVLDDPPARERLLGAIDRGEPGWESVGPGIGWDRVAIGTHAPDASLTGRPIAEVAAERGLRPAEAIVELLLADPNTGMVGHGMREDDVRAILSRPDVAVGTDGLAISPEGPLGPYAVHPRYYGTFPRILGTYVRAERLLTIEAAVRKMTCPAGGPVRARGSRPDRGRGRRRSRGVRPRPDRGSLDLRAAARVRRRRRAGRRERPGGLGRRARGAGGPRAATRRALARTVGPAAVGRDHAPGLVDRLERRRGDRLQLVEQAVAPVGVARALEVPVRAVVGHDHPVPLHRKQDDLRLRAESGEVEARPSSGTGPPSAGSRGRRRRPRAGPATGRNRSCTRR